MNETLKIERYQAIVDQAAAIKVETPEQAEFCRKFIAKLRSVKEDVRIGTRETIATTRAAYEAAKAQCDDRIAMVDKADKTANAELTRYLVEQRQIREKAERDERARLLKEAEDRKIEIAAKAELEGKPIAAAAILAAPIRVERPAPAFTEKTAAMAPPAGAQLRETWKWRVVDQAKIPAAFIETITTTRPDKAKIDDLVKAKHKAAEAELGTGIEVYADYTTAHRRTW